jgi:hypothetical protein
MDALIEHLDGQGFAKLAQPGHAPAKSDGHWLWSIEIERAKGASFVAVPPGLSATDVKPYLAIKAAFVETYNATYGLQAVKLKAGETPFKAPDPPKNVKQN